LASNACPSSVVSLDRLEAPYPPPDEVLASLQLGLEEINRYAEPGLVEELRSALARHNQLAAKNIVPVRDRVEALSAVLRYIAKTEKRLPRVLLPSPSFQELRKVIEQYAGRVVEVGLVDRGDSWGLPISSLIEALGSSDVLLLDNPNDPTGSLLLISLRDAKKLLDEACSAGALVVIDESFYEFSGVTLSDLVDSHPCLVIMRSMEQAYALAGLGLAYFMAGEEIAEELASTATPPSRASLVAGIAALRNQQYYLRMVERVIAERERVRQILLGIRGVTAYRSWSNFLLVDTGIEKSAEKLCARGVAVAGASLGSRYVRVTIGNQGDNNSFLAALTQLVREETKLA